MEYEFINDPITGEVVAKFSLEHEIIGPWLEVEVGNNQDKLSELLTTIEKIENGKQLDIIVTGREYSVAFSENDVTIQTNSSMDGSDILPENLLEQELDFDGNSSASCGLDDFKTFLLSWAKFNAGN